MNHRLEIIVLKWSAAGSDLLLHCQERLHVWRSVFNTMCRVGEKFEYRRIFR